LVLFLPDPSDRKAKRSEADGWMDGSITSPPISPRSLDGYQWTTVVVVLAPARLRARELITSPASFLPRRVASLSRVVISLFFRKKKWDWWSDFTSSV
jgi:hypothetical protein